MIQPQDITGMVLAGGRGSRMGGIDKGLQPFQGTPLALHVLQRLQPQVGACMINANRNLDRYADFGVPVHADTLPDYAGPLAGFVSGLMHCPSPWLLTVPCDSPRLPWIWPSAWPMLHSSSMQILCWLRRRRSAETARCKCVASPCLPCCTRVYWAVCKTSFNQVAAKLIAGLRCTHRCCALLTCQAMTSMPLPMPIPCKSCTRSKAKPEIFSRGRLTHRGGRSGHDLYQNQGTIKAPCRAHAR